MYFQSAITPWIIRNKQNLLPGSPSTADWGHNTFVYHIVHGALKLTLNMTADRRELDSGDLRSGRVPGEDAGTI